MILAKTAVLNIEIVSDVVCPWCFIGKRRIEKALKLISHPSEMRVTWKPFELNPALPKAGVDYKGYLKAKFGDSEEVQAIQSHVQQAGDKVDLYFRFDRIERLPNTLDAHRLIWFAGQAGRQDEIVEGLFRAVFLEGKFVGDHVVLAKIAASVGLDHSKVKHFLDSNQGTDEVRYEIEQALHRGVEGVPNFLINGRYVIRGAQPPDVMVQILEQALKE
jgi:predicted DsbA family dithiol-disulfide isomerase